MAARTLMYLYKMKSAGGLALKDALGVQQILHEGSQFKGDKETVVINWGRGDTFENKEIDKCKIINHPLAISLAINKTSFLQAASQVSRTVPFTTSKWLAKTWAALGHTIYCRMTVNGYEGKGIEIVKGLDLPSAPLYTQAVKSEREYRVHVMDGKAIVVHRKVAKERYDADLKQDIRNTDNGWVFRKVIQYPQDIVDRAIPAVKAVGLDFAAVDVLWDGEKAWLLEANTAPGIDGMDFTINAYKEGLKKLVDKKLKV